MKRWADSIAPEPIATWLRTAGGPYPVASLSIAIASAIYKRREKRTPIIEQTRLNRDTLIETLKSQGIKAMESQANFVLARFDDAASVHAQLHLHLHRQHAALQPRQPAAFLRHAAACSRGIGKF